MLHQDIHPKFGKDHLPTIHFSGANSLFNFGGVHARKNLQLLRPFGDMKGLGSSPVPNQPTAGAFTTSFVAVKAIALPATLGGGVGGWGQPPVALILAESANLTNPKGC